MQPLTPAQRQIAEENHPLIYSFLHRHMLNIEDWYSIIAIGYLKAAALYDPKRGTFSTIAWISMDSALKQELKKHSKDLICASLDEVMLGMNSRYELVDDPLNPLNDLIDSIDLQNSIRKLDKQLREIVMWKAAGISQMEIAKKMGTSQSYISRCLKQAYFQLFNRLPPEKTKRPAEVRTPRSA